MIGRTVSRYFGLRFLWAVLAVFAGTLVLTAMVDFLELLRRIQGLGLGGERLDIFLSTLHLRF